MRKVKWTKDILADAVLKSFSMRSVLSKLGLKYSGGNHSHISTRIRNYGIDTSHFTGQSHLKGKSHNWTKRIPLADILIENSQYTNNGRLKIRLLREQLLRPVCYECCGLPIWCGKKLTLELDHINGQSNDNRITNLRLLCPNCHSQTETFSNNKRYRILKVEPI